MTVPQARHRARRWLSIVALMPLAGRWVVACAAVMNVLIGVLPVAFVVAMSVMAGDLSRVLPAGRLDGLRGTVLAAFAVGLVALVAQNALAPVQAALGELVTRRIDGHCIARLMDAGINKAPLELLEREDVRDKLSDAYEGLVGQWLTPGAAAAGLLALVARYAQLGCALVVLAVVMDPSTAAVVAVTAAVVRAGSRSALMRWSHYSQHMLANTRRRSRYVFATGSDLNIAKESRILGIRRWLRARAHRENTAYLTSLWRVRREVYLVPFLVLSAVLFAGGALSLLSIVHAVEGGVTALELVLAVQVVLVPLQIGTFFPEADLQTQDGMLTYETISSLERTFREAERDRRPSPVGKPTVPGGTIRFENVRFRYPGSEREVLSGLNLELPAGRSTAVVGLNGAGKTTMLKLLLGLYTPTAGVIRCAGDDMRDIDPAAWRAQFAVVFQDYVRYELDVAANVTMGSSGDPDATGVWDVLEQARAQGLVRSLPSGISTVLSSRHPGGVDLSGGQWQRIALARALHAVRRGASVLVLDEPTAQMDARAEVAFHDRFLELTSGLTSIIVSHRFSTVLRADHIVVLSDGKVVEAGTHDELLDLDGRYATLFRLQAERFTTSADNGRRTP